MPLIETTLLQAVTPSVIDAAKGLIARVWPDPAQQAEAQRRLAELEQAGELEQVKAQLQLQLAQIEVNKLDAQGNWFQRGWRPYIGWTGGVGLSYQFLLQPLLAWLSLNVGWQPPPVLDSAVLYGLVGQLLGLGALRTIERVKGKA
jgi:Holin of 3TMs, for gene-transfer release